MAVMATVFNEVQRSTLEALCDTFVPAVETDSGDPVEREFMARSAADLQVAAQMEAMLADALLPEEAAEIGGLLDALAAEGLALETPLEARTQIVHGVRAASPEAKLGLAQLKGLTLLRVLRDAGRIDRAEPQLGGAGVSGADLGGALRRRCAQDALARFGERRAGHPDVRRLRRRFRRRRLGDRGRGGPRRQVRADSGSRPVPQRAGLQPARGAGVFRSSTTAAAWPRPRTGPFRYSPAPRSAAAPSSTT